MTITAVGPGQGELIPNAIKTHFWPPWKIRIAFQEAFAAPLDFTFPTFSSTPCGQQLPTADCLGNEIRFREGHWWNGATGSLTDPPETWLATMVHDALGQFACCEGRDDLRRLSDKQMRLHLRRNGAGKRWWNLAVHLARPFREAMCRRRRKRSQRTGVPG